MVQGVELGDLIAEGGFGAVYRARQSSVNRDVAVKVIRQGLADDPEFIRRFETEAQIVARLEHPHIVPLYDFWREPGGAFLVMRWLRGGTVEQALASGNMSVELVVRIVEQVGGALAAAHDAGVLHRDVKPSNILLDERGDAYLSDFGIAVDIATSGGDVGTAGSPLYMSPEQLGSGENTVRSDIYSFGVVIFELLAGRPPDTANTIDDLLRQKTSALRPVLLDERGDLPLAVSDVLGRALEADPRDRFGSVEEFADAFVHAMTTTDGSSTTPPQTEVSVGVRSTIVKARAELQNPYKGLRAFGEIDAGDFHGRRTLTGRILDAVRGSRFVTIVGPSGSGKSSVVRAGVIPAIRADAIDGSGSWFVVSMIPGPLPFEELEAALLKIAVNPPESLASQLREDERGLIRAIKRVLPDDESEILLLVDQFEELFTLTDRKSQDRFLESLAAIAGDDRCRARVVCTVRADFYDGPLAHPALGALVRDHSIAVSPLTREELADAITAPALRLGVSLEPSLAARLVADVAGSPGSLPMLQYTLTELFETRDGALMTEAAYDRLGGISGAIAARAEEIFGLLDTEQQHAARRLFGRLITLGEGTEDTRRRVNRDELTTDQATSDVIVAYGNARLLAFDRNPRSRSATIEVAHEALIREWPRLRAWIDEDREQLRVLNHLTVAAEAWDSRGRDSADLYRGARLGSASDFSSTHTDLTPVETAFVQASSAEAESELKQERRTNRRLRLLVATSAVIAAVALIAGAVALQQRSRANSSAERANSQAAAAATAAELADVRSEEALEAQARAEISEERAIQTGLDAAVRRMSNDAIDLRDRNPALSMLIAVAAFQLDRKPETLGALQSTLTRTDDLLGFLGPGIDYIHVEFADDNTLVARTNDEVHVWNLSGRQLRHRIEIAGSGPIAILSPSRAIVVSPGGRLFLLDIDDGTAPKSVVIEILGIRDIALDADSKRVAALTSRGEVVVLDYELTELSRLTLSNVIHRTADADINLLESSRYIAAAMGSIFVAGGTNVVLVNSAGDIAWSTSGPALAAAAGIDADEFERVSVFAAIEVNDDGSIIHALVAGTGVWNIDTSDGSILEFLRASSVGESLDVSDTMLIVGTEVINAVSGEIDHALTPPGGTRDGSASSEQQVVALAGSAGISLWSLNGDQILAQAIPVSTATTATLDPSGDRVAWNDFPDSNFGIWNLADNNPVTPDLGDQIGHLTWLSSGSISTRERTGLLQVWNGADYTPLSGRFPSAGISPFNVTRDNRVGVILTIPPRSGRVKVYDLAQAELLADIVVFDSQAQFSLGVNGWIDVSPDGSLFALAAASGEAAVLSKGDWEIIHRIDLGDGQRVNSIAFSGDGQTLAIHSTAGQLHYLSTSTGVLTPGPSVGAPEATILMPRIAFGADDDTVLVGLKEGVQIWDHSTGERVGEMFPNETLRYGTPSYDGRQAITGIGDHLLIWNLETDQWVDIACLAAGRDLSVDEWIRYGPPDAPFEGVCPAA